MAYLLWSVAAANVDFSMMVLSDAASIVKSGSTSPNSGTFAASDIGKPKTLKRESEERTISELSSPTIDKVASSQLLAICANLSAGTRASPSVSRSTRSIVKFSETSVSDAASCITPS